MGETANIVGIYGAIDDAVRPYTDDGRARRGEVQDLLPAYRDEATSWYEEFRKTGARVRPEAEPLPDYKSALRALSKIPARGRMRAAAGGGRGGAAGLWEIPRRPRSVAGADAIVFEDGREGDGQDKLLEVLDDRQLIQENLDLWWERVAQVAAAVGFIESPAHLGPRPCINELVETPHGPATVLITQFVTDVCGFERAIEFLDPVTWPRQSGFWCEMYPTGVERPPGTLHYDETVAVDCPAATAFWTVSAKLGFRFRRHGNAAWTTYDLSRHRPTTMTCSSTRASCGSRSARTAASTSTRPSRSSSAARSAAKGWR